MAGLKDMNQLITYQYEADSMDRQWYSIRKRSIGGTLVDLPIFLDN